MEGWIKIHRVIQKHWLFENDKWFKWWIIILFEVNHSDNKFTLGYNVINIRRGQSSNSLRRWAYLFNTTTKTLVKFLELLENDKMISRKVIGKGRQSTTLITVSNYEDYQGVKETQGTTQGTTQSTTQGTTQGKRKGGTNKKEKNEENLKNENNGNKKESNIDYQKIIDIYNSVCVNLPEVLKLTDQRKSALKARLNEYSLAQMGDVIQKASDSKFLNGFNEKGWTADFDWIMKPTNFIKILEGNYVNKNNNHGKATQQQQAFIDLAREYSKQAD